MPRCPDERLTGTSGFPSAEEVDVEALFASLREEVRRSGADPGAAAADDRHAARAEAERLWPVSADRVAAAASGVRGGLGTPVKAGAPQADALVRRAARLRPALVQRGGAASGRRPRAAASPASRRSWRFSAPRTSASGPMRIAVLRAAGAVRARRRRDLHRRARRRSCARAGTRPSSSRCRSSGTRAPACSPRRSSGGCSTSRSRTAARSTSSSRRSSRPTSCATARSASGSCTSSGRRTSSTAPSSGSSARRRGAGAAAPGAGARPRRRSARRRASSRPRQRRRAPRALHRARRRGAPASAAGARRTAATRHSGFVLSASRLDRAKRIDLLLEAAALDADPRGRDRLRRPGPRAARGARPRARARRPRPLRGRVGARASSRSCTRRCSAVYYAPVDEDFGMGPYEAFLSEKPVITTTDAGGPLDVVPDGDGARRRRPTPAAVARAAALAARARARRGRRYGTRGQGARGRGDVGRRDRRGSSREGRVLLARCRRSASGIADYSALLLPALRRRADVTVVKRGAKRPPRGTDLCVYHIGNNPDAHGWILDALRRAARARRPARLRAPSSRRRRHDRPRATGTATSTRWSASTASSAACSRTACSTSACRRSGRPGRRSSRSRARCSRLATGLVVHSRYVARACARSRLRGPDRADPAPRVARCRASPPGRSRASR